MNLDAHGSVIGIVDARSILADCRALRDAKGLSQDEVVVIVGPK